MTVRNLVATASILVAQCGIHWYPRHCDAGIFWRHCKTCGQQLIYTADRNAKPQECKGRRC